MSSCNLIQKNKKKESVIRMTGYQKSMTCLHPLLEPSTNPGDTSIQLEEEELYLGDLETLKLLLHCSKTFQVL